MGVKYVCDYCGKEIERSENPVNIRLVKKVRGNKLEHPRPEQSERGGEGYWLDAWMHDQCSEDFRNFVLLEIGKKTKNRVGILVA